MRPSRAVSVLAILLASLACGRTPPTPRPGPTPLASAPASSVWLRTAGGQKADQSWAALTDAEGNLYWGMQQQPADSFFTDWVIDKYAPDGTLLWQARWGGDCQEKLFILALGPDFLLAGGEQEISLDVRQADMALVAFDLHDGHLRWEFTFDQGFGYEEIDGLAIEGGEIYVSGWTTGAQTGNDVGLLKLDGNGRLIWFTAWGGPGWDEANGQLALDDQYVYITGRYGGQDLLRGGQGLLAAFRKEDGAFVRHVVWGGDPFYDGYGLAGDGEHLYVTGITLAPPANGQIFVQKWDRQLNLIWERQWGGAGGDQARAIAVTPDGRIVVAGNTMMAGDRQVALLIYDGEGNLLSETLWGGAGAESVHGLWLDGEYAYLAGQITPAGAPMSDALLLKVRLDGPVFPPPP